MFKVNKCFYWALCMLILGLVGCSSVNNKNNNVNYTESRRVGNVTWYKSYITNPTKIAKKSIPDNKSRAFFYRKKTSADLQTSVNIALNGRFQTSIQPNRFSQVLTCTGMNELGAMITGKKNNFLKDVESVGINTFTGIEMVAKKNYYFEVFIQANGKSSVKRVDEKEALAAMSSMKHQSHQISRVVPNCAKAPARIQLAVYFDTSKYHVKSKYYEEIERVAIYLRKYTNTSVVIEGHTDNRASTSYNQRLSENRAKAVVAVLTNKFGIEARRLSSIGYGESRPIADNNSASGLQKNRRVIASFSVSK